MASGIAIDVLKSTSAALAPAIFGPWMNISGSLLAGWWRRRPVKVGEGVMAGAAEVAIAGAAADKTAAATAQNSCSEE